MDLFQLAHIFFPTFISDKDEAKLNMLMSDDLVKNTAKYLY